MERKSFIKTAICLLFTACIGTLCFSQAVLHPYTAFYSESLLSDNTSGLAGSNDEDKNTRVMSATRSIDIDFDLARNQSFGFFYDISEKSWNLLREISSSRQDHLVKNEHATYTAGGENRIRPSGDKKIETPWWQSHYEPDFGCQFKRRVGGSGNGDGPKWVCDPHRLKEISKQRKKQNPDKPGCIIYSVGSHGDFSFELSMQQTLGKDTCEVHIFDMDDYSRDMPQNMNMYYHTWGLSHKSMKGEEGYVYKTILDTIKELGHDDAPAIDVFKIDCEGCEFATYLDWLGAESESENESDSKISIPMFQQILVEIHRANADSMRDFFDAMKQAGYVRFSKEHNVQMKNLPLYEYGFLKLSKDYWLPDAIDPGVIVNEE